MTKTDDDSDDVEQWFSRHRLPPSSSSFTCNNFKHFFEGEKLLNFFFRRSKFQGQLTKVLANAIQGRRSTPRSKVKVNTGHDAIWYKGPSTSKKCFDSLQCLDLSETQCLHLYHSRRAKKIDLNPNLSFWRSLFTFYWRGKSGKDVKAISMIAKNSWNDDFFHPVKTIHRALGQRKLCIGAVVPEKWQIDK